MSDPVTAVTDAIGERFVAPDDGRPRERRVLRPRKHGSFRAVLSNYPFLRLWIAQAVSQTANSMVDFSLLLRVGQTVDYHDVAQANTAVSFVILAFSLPAVVFGPIAGAVADRVSRRNLMVVTNVCARGTGGALLTRTADLAGSDRARLLLLCIVPLWRRRTVLHARPGSLDSRLGAARSTHGGERALQPHVHRNAIARVCHTRTALPKLSASTCSSSSR